MMLASIAFILISATAQGPQAKDQQEQQVPALIDSCTKLPKNQQEFAKALDMKEQALFCSVFDNNQRLAALDFYKKNPKLTQKDAVMQIAKDNQILFDSKPGGACGAH
jgi:hypothetical protein